MSQTTSCSPPIGEPYVALLVNHVANSRMQYVGCCRCRSTTRYTLQLIVSFICSWTVIPLSSSLLHVPQEFGRYRRSALGRCMQFSDKLDLALAGLSLLSLSMEYK